MARDTPEDPDLIARVYPADPAGHARDVIMKHPWGVAREREPSLPARSRTSRESTVESQGGDELEGLPYLELRFSQLPRSSSGFVFGTSKATSDVVLPGWPGISRNHFALTYKNTFRDGKYRLVVRDLGSTSGTVVTYDRRGGERRSKFDWAVSGFVVPASAKTLIIEPHRSVRFRLVVPHHNLRSPDYIRNVERFRQGAAAAEDLLGVLGFQHGPETERPTGIHTPLEIPVFIKQDLIAQGASGVVSRYWNVSNGEEHACKQPVGKDYQKRAWEKEIDIMKQVSHENIVRLCFSQLVPEPRLFLEYMPFGSVEDVHRRHPFSHNECLTILHQGLSALSYLHGRPEPLVHQGINPRNILVQHHEPGNNHASLRIKLSDFGFSKAPGLRSIGAATYFPPEALENGAPRKHTTAADIWSLGLVILRLAYGLPVPGRGSDSQWCHKVVQEVKTRDSDDLLDILRHMLVIDPSGRHSATACLQAVSQLLDASRTRSATPTPAPSAPKGKTREILAGQQHSARHGESVPGYSQPAAASAFSPTFFDAGSWVGSDLHTTALSPNHAGDIWATASETEAALDAYFETINAGPGPSGTYATPSEAFDMPFDDYGVPSELPAAQAGQGGYGGDAAPAVQAQQPPSRHATPSEVGPGAAPGETLILRQILLDRRQPTKYKSVERLGGETLAIYQPQAPGSIRLTSLLSASGLPKDTCWNLAGSVPQSKMTRVKTGYILCQGTWVSFDYALELADLWGLPPFVKTAIEMAREDSDRY